MPYETIFVTNLQNTLRYSVLHKPLKPLQGQYDAYPYDQRMVYRRISPWIEDVLHVWLNVEVRVHGK